jgi:hypothetical protein
MQERRAAASRRSRKGRVALGSLLILTRRDRSIRRAYLIALACYAAMLADFFIFNLPVNEALRAWTPRTLPADWSDYRLRWEIGHAFTALFSMIAFVFSNRVLHLLGEIDFRKATREAITCMEQGAYFCVSARSPDDFNTELMEWLPGKEQQMAR